MTKIAINGFGRIGRIFFRQVFSAIGAGGPANSDGWEVVAINDLGTRDNLEYLLKYDSVYGKYEKGTGKVQFFQEKDPTKLPWGKLGIDIVIESTGVFETAEKAQAHITAGAKHVVITAPAKDDVTPTMTPNVGWSDLKANTQKLTAITSNASCTTNATNPVIAILMQSVGIQKAMMTTVHANTATQSTVDGPGSKDFRFGRAGAWNIIPSTTGAAKATTRVIPALKNKFDAVSVRVPVISGSLIDLTFLASRATTVEEINAIFRKAASSPEWQGIVEATDEPIVSSDILGNSHGSIVDLGLTRVVDGDLVKVFAWYDNEWGYCAMLLKHIQEVAKLL